MSNNMSVATNGFTALMLASQRGHVKVVQLLLEHGARTDIVSAYGQSALFMAIMNDHPRVVKILLDWGSDKNARDVVGYLPIQYTNNTEIIEMLENA